MKNYKIISQLDRTSFIIEIKNKTSTGLIFEGRRLASLEDINSDRNLTLFGEEHYEELRRQ